jgi:hypothetical protein
MMECKSMTTPMTTNMNTLGDSDSDLVNPMILILGQIFVSLSTP